MGDTITARQPLGHERVGVVKRIDKFEAPGCEDLTLLEVVDTEATPNCLIDYQPETGPCFWCYGRQVVAVSVAGE
jgi:hypothetical protein